MNVNDYLQEHDYWVHSQRWHVTPGGNPGQMWNTAHPLVKPHGKPRNLCDWGPPLVKPLVNGIPLYQGFYQGSYPVSF